MKNITHLLLFAIGICLAPALIAQQSYKVHFAHGTEVFPENFKTEMVKSIPAADLSEGYFVRYVQFNALPSTAQRTQLEQEGVIWQGYVNYGTYLMIFPKGFKLSTLEPLGARSIMAANPQWKMHRNLKERPFGAWAVHGTYVDISVQLYPFLNIQDGATLLEQNRYQIIQKGNQNGYLLIRVPQADLERIAALPYVKWVELMQEPPVKDDTNGRSLHRSNLLDSDHPLGLKYNGEGVNVLVRDDGAVGPHIDFQGRLLNQDGVAAQLQGTHGDGVAGIIGGAGNLDPTKKGMAAGADIYVVDYVNNFQDATLPLFQDQNVTITNSSYSDGCNTGYTLATQTVDEQIYQNPTLMHVFSAGNSNNSDCGYGAGNQWGNITGGHKMAKNAIATANLRVNGVIEPSSSRGPAHDGRLKPDISAHGAEQNSTDPNNSYQVFGGTSAAAPGIAGCLAQLTHAYRTINNTPEAPTALLKLALMTTANELGNIGPDYIFGWGHVNNFRALRLLENNRYTSGSVENGATQTHTVSIPSQTKQAKLMIYWAERPSDENTARALLNDLDLTVTGPDGTVYRPWLLDPTPDAAILNTPAGKGRDSLNNMEQVAIDNPVAGAYTVRVNGYEVPFGPQSYYLAWEFLNDRVQLTYPAGGEGFVSGTKEWIRWDAYDNTDLFTLRYSVDGGTTFLPIAGNLANNVRMFEWTVPSTTSGNVKLMLIRGARRDTTDFPLSISAQPTNLAVAKVCPDSITLTWNKIANDTVAYDVFMLGEKYMELKGTSAIGAQTYQLPITDASAESWFSLRTSHPTGLKGRRIEAIRWEGGLKGCPQPFDAALASIITPSGSAIVSCGPVTQAVTIQVKNEGINPLTGATASYAVDGQSPVTETLPTIAPNATLDFTFATPLTFSQNGTTELSITVNAANDNYAANNGFSQNYVVIAQSQTGTFVNDFESTPAIPAGWSIINPDEDAITWVTTPTDITGADGLPTRALGMNHFNYNPAGAQEDYLYMVPLDLANVQYPTLTFDYSHARYDNTYSDGLRIEAYPNCDVNGTPVVIWEKIDPDYATTAAQTSPFTPNEATDWAKGSVSLEQFSGETVVLRFVSINGYGNNAYIDNIGIESIIPTFPVAQFAIADTVCRADTVVYVAQASTGAGDVYTWNFGASASPVIATGPGPHNVVYALPGTRTIRLIVSNPFGADTLSQTTVVRAFPTATFTQTTDNLTVTFLSNSTNVDTYFWDFGDGNTSTLEDPVHTYAIAGTYTVTLTTKNTCRETVKTNTITLTTGTVEQIGLEAVKILPNPNNGRFEVVITNSQSATETQLQLFDGTGRLLKEINVGIVGQETRVVPFHNLQLPAGTYQLQVRTAKGNASFPVIVHP